MKFTAAVVAALHKVWSATGFTVGVGFTVMVKVTGVPGQPLTTGVTVTVEDIGAVPALVAVNGAILPVPDAPRPTAVLLLVQLYTVPATAPVKVTAAEVAPLHKVWFVTAATVGVGVTVIVKGTAGPVHPDISGVIVTVEDIGAVPVLVPVKEPMLPAPEAPRPVAVLLLVQL